MTPIQFKRWRRFSILMAKRGWKEMTPARRRKVAKNVNDLLDYLAYDESEAAEIYDWDSGPVYICDRVSTWITDQGYWSENPHTGEDRDHKFADQIRACIRAGLDMASSPSAGVIGFDVDDLRRMYSGKVPKWISTQFEPPITHLSNGSDGIWL